MTKLAPWLLVILLSTAPEASEHGSDRLDVSAYPTEQQKNYEVFRVKCSKCHTLARPLNSRLTGEGWRAYIRKMIRKAGSGINDDNGKAVFSFLEYYYQARAEGSSRQSPSTAPPPAPTPPPAPPPPTPPPTAPPAPGPASSGGSTASPPPEAAPVATAFAQPQLSSPPSSAVVVDQGGVSPAPVSKTVVKRKKVKRPIRGRSKPQSDLELQPLTPD
ncbi:MAG TPA: hypothetical protein VEY30_08885 [Myxococcaceae bacterium]|nr:hypothetical protein [Myxococcaceae bacterium]